MGAKNSKTRISGRNSFNASSTNPWSHQAYPQSLDKVTDALARDGLEASKLIIGIDFTKSNEWKGRISFQRRNLHAIGDELNPYEQVISIIGRTLSSIGEDNLIHCFGFGDASTNDQDVFSFYPGGRCCDGIEEALARYKELVPQLQLGGPTSFAPIIEMAITTVKQSGRQFHVLVIIADGEVTRTVDADGGPISSQETRTVEAIVKASEYPLSIILVGVGDGPWDMIRELNLGSRAFSNFQFVNFTDIMAQNLSLTRKEAIFAHSALMRIPSHYKAALDRNLIGGNNDDRVALPPPLCGEASSSKPEPSAPSSDHHHWRMRMTDQWIRQSAMASRDRRVVKAARTARHVRSADRTS